MQPPSDGLVSLACRPILDFASSLHERREQGTCLSDRPLVLSGPELREADDHQDGADSRGSPCVAILASLSLLPDEILLGATALPSCLSTTNCLVSARCGFALSVSTPDLKILSFAFFCLVLFLGWPSDHNITT